MAKVKDRVGEINYNKFGNLRLSVYVVLMFVFSVTLIGWSDLELDDSIGAFL